MSSVASVLIVTFPVACGRSKLITSGRMTGMTPCCISLPHVPIYRLYAFEQEENQLLSGLFVDGCSAYNHSNPQLSIWELKTHCVSTQKSIRV